MCGITGLYLRDSAVDPAVVTRMRDVIAHRGPDDADNYIEGPLGLGHRRLSIIDLGTGHQPMQTADGRYTIIFNGEIYNYRELRRDLEDQGARFRTQSDTEVILALHALQGDAGVGRLNGIFTYALWDRERSRLLLARDRAGIKPLYYAQAASGLAFGSEIKSLFESGLTRPRLESKHVAEYLVFRHVAGPENLYSGVRALPPGHLLEVLGGKASAPQAFWRPDTCPAPFDGDYRAAVETLDTALSAAVRRQMIADVPLGTFCSGGIDSSLVTAMAARHAGAAVNTYSVGFDEEGWDESRFARLAAAHCGTDHHEIRVSEARFAELLPKLIWHHDLPLNFANSVHIFAVSELAKRDVKVVLTGEGADELFGGYPRYYLPRLAAALDRLPLPVRKPVLALAGLIPGHRIRKLLSYGRLAPDERMLFNASNVDLDTVRQALPGEFTPAEWRFRHDAIARACRLWPDHLGAMSQLDFETYLLSILNRQDKMSMAASLESRVPFLDNEIIELARSLPSGFKQTLRDRKRVLKDVARRYLPAAIVDRRKSGFGVPLAAWMRSGGPVSRLLDEATSGTRLRSRLPGVELPSLIRDHRAGHADHSEFLWGALNLGIWLERVE
jgi:asparagine synthase (glutamine-hydrolysing)